MILVTTWTDRVIKFCEEFNIPIAYLADTLYEPKVIPMLRGKAFEYTVMLKLEEILPKDLFNVSKTPMNAQLGSHDVDVSVTHLPSNVEIRIECKLTKKESFRTLGQQHQTVDVKCMRSRTMGSEIAGRVATERNIPISVVQVHNDQYFPDDFDVVITSLGNTFYITDRESKLFAWGPDEEGLVFLEHLFGTSHSAHYLKDKAFNQLYAAYSQDLRIARENNFTCTRKKCEDNENCGFIPNYPKIHFYDYVVQQPWVDMSSINALLLRIVDEKLHQ